jgi:arylsulfatase A-like enzyme
MSFNYCLILSIVPILIGCNNYNLKTERPNVLFITVDDMNDWSTLFNTNNPIRTPNLIKLARKGVFFSNAYSSSPACNPSRASVMTGTRPHKTGVYGNSSNWRRALKGVKTIQRHLKENGYLVFGSGKIFHHHSDWAFHDNASFDEYLMMSINEPYPDKKINGLEGYGSRNTDWGPWPNNIEKTVDYKTVEYALNKLNKKYDKPFFLNIGIYKPHSPFFVPQKYFDKYPMDNLVMPPIPKNDTEDLPEGAKKMTLNKKWFWNGMLKAKEKDPNAYLEYVQAYQACGSFADDMIGKIIDALEKSQHRENTIIILWSDHGFHLGEKNHFEKFALWEKSNHIPFIIYAPNVTKSGTIINNPVDMTSIYPTLSELCGLKIPEHTDGYSLVPLLKDSSVKTKPALMTYMKGNHAVRSERWRYIEYFDGSIELYDHFNDPNEWNNVASKEENKEIISNLKSFIPKVNKDQVLNL